MVILLTNIKFFCIKDPEFADKLSSLMFTKP